MKNKKKLIIISILIFVLILIFLGVIIFYNIKRQIKKDLDLNYDNTISVENNDTYYSSLLRDFNYDNYKIINDSMVNTDTIGEFEYKLEIKDKYGFTHYRNIVFNVIDDIAPVIEINNKELSTVEGTEIDLKSNANVSDNYDSDLIINIDGDYDFNKVGKYELEYVVKDSSNNETRESFTLNVKAKEVIKPEVKNEQKKSESNNITQNTDGTFTTSKGFKGVTKNGITYIDGLLIANKTYSLPSSYAPGLNSEVKAKAEEMFASAKAMDSSLNLHIQSGFRSYDTQNRLYNNYVNSRGKAAADTFSARPGHSEHQSGLAFDVCQNGYGCINSSFDDTPPANWLANNCYKYGFILRYPKGKTNETGYKYESWHFRYVGVDLATKLYNNGDWITLENYFGITSEYNN